VLSLDRPDLLLAGCNGSPLIVGLGTREYLVVSDPSALAGVTNSYVVVEDRCFVKVRPGGCFVADVSTGNIYKPKLLSLQTQSYHIDKGGYPHYMLKEIYEIPAIVRLTIERRLTSKGTSVSFPELSELTDKMEWNKRWFLTGMGTALHAAKMTELLFTYPAVVTESAAQFTDRDRRFLGSAVLVAISQSGETADTHSAVQLAKQAYARVISLVNVVDSRIARSASFRIYNNIGPEKAVASTKALLSQVTILALLAIWVSQHSSAKDRNHELAALRLLPAFLEQLLDNINPVKWLALQLKTIQHLYVLGRGNSYAVALEAALKMAEVSYIHAQALHGADMKHGPLALIEVDTPVIMLIPPDKLHEKNLTTMHELKARGARIIAIANQTDVAVAGLADVHLAVPNAPVFLFPWLAVTICQLLAYYTGVARGIDVDKPRNLAKSVTVE
jgi:glucosamine--fructose-6-phosphate aminotransferase (isomerizing)